MKGLLLILSAFLLTEAVVEVTSLTNEEFFNWAKNYATDIETFDIDEDDSVDVDSEEVITLPGNPDDEVDFDYLLAALGIHYENETKGVEGKGTSLWWHHHHHHHHHHHRPSFHCGCHHYSCKCCLHHKFKVNLWIHKFKFNLHACLQVAYLRSNIGFELTFTINGHRLYHKEVSLKHPPGLCFGIPGLRAFARVCLELYDINLHTKHLCSRLTGVIDLKFKKFKVHLKLGCFRIPILEKDAFLLLVNNPDFLKVQPVNEQPAHDLDSRELDLATLFRGLQSGQFEEFDDY